MLFSLKILCFLFNVLHSNCFYFCTWSFPCLTWQSLKASKEWMLGNVWENRITAISKILLSWELSLVVELQVLLSHWNYNLCCSWSTRQGRNPAWLWSHFAFAWIGNQHTPSSHRGLFFGLVLFCWVKDLCIHFHSKTTQHEKWEELRRKRM